MPLSHSYELAATYSKRFTAPPPAAPSVDIDFTTGALPGGYTFTRASTATNSTYLDASNLTTYSTLAIDTPRMTQFGILIEPARTNLFLNSDAMVTQTITVATGPYVIWLIGTGSLAVAAGTATGIGFGTASVWNPVYLTITGAGTVVCTVTGSISRAQAEAGTGPSSYIKSTASQGTRAAEQLSADVAALITAEATYWVEWMSPGVQDNARILTVGAKSFSSDNSTDQIIYHAGTGAGSGQTFNSSGASIAQINTNGTVARNAICRTALSVSATGLDIASNGSASDGIRTAITRPSSLTGVTLGSGGSGGPINGFIRRFRYWPYAMSAADLARISDYGYFRTPLLDLGFTGGTGTLPRFFFFTHPSASTGVATDSTYLDAAGSTYTTYAITVPRMLSSGLLLEQGRTNYLANSATPASINTATLPNNNRYIAWMVGTGSMTVNQGTIPGGTGFGQTATAGAPIWFTTSGGTGQAAVAITGSVNRFQIEVLGAAVNVPVGTAPSSFIQTTTAGQIRQGEFLVMQATNWWPPVNWTYVIEFTGLGYAVNATFLSVGTSATDRFSSFFTGAVVGGVPPDTPITEVQTNSGQDYTGVISPPIVNQLPPSTSAIQKVAIGYSSNGRPVAANGQLGNPATALQSNPRISPPTTLQIGQQIPTGNFYPHYRLRRVRIYDYVMSNAELIAVTT